jgi:predicted DNA-binding transcriptional regulator AlpA
MQDKRLLPDRKVCERYSVSQMTLWRWDRDPQLNFPRAIRIRGRKYRDEGELDAFDAAQVRDADIATVAAFNRGGADAA